MTYPRSPYDRVAGLVYFPRVLDKIRLNMAGQLHVDYHSHLGERMDARCCTFLGVTYDDLVSKVTQGLSDEEIAVWSFSHGRTPSEQDIQLWNSFMTKRGWREEDPEVMETLKRFKGASGFDDRDDIQTFFDYFEVDEKRKP